MKKIVILVLILVVVSVSLYAFTKRVNVSKSRVSEAQTYARNNGYNTNYCIFVDFSAYSGSSRFILYDLKNDRQIYACRCAHGNDGREKMEATINSFSNVVNSHKSSLGKYRIGKKRKINSVDGMFDVSMFGIPCYETHGLESSNSNAYKRGILIHPDYLLSNSSPAPIFPFHSFGCFAIPDESFNIISKYIQNSNKPVLLWAYYTN